MKCQIVGRQLLHGPPRHEESRRDIYNF